MAVRRSTTTRSASGVETMPGERVLWNGPLFGRLTKSGRDFLTRNGFTRFEQGIEQEGKRLAFVWPNKSGPQFPIEDDTAAHVRPYPTELTNMLDDKICLAEALARQRQEDPTVPQIAPATITSLEEARDDKLYFVKHRHGAQGKSVYCYDKHQLGEWFARSRNAHDFVIQEEIPPALSKDGRKFILRSHILIYSNHPSPTALLHRNVICQHHASPYDAGNKAAQISQAGKKSKMPAPVLLQDLDPDHPAAGALPNIQECSRQLVLSVWKNFQLERQSDTTCFALLGVDSLLTPNGQAMICEVNSHPALGWGTMSQVPSRTFTELIEDALSILVLREQCGGTRFVSLL